MAVAALTAGLLGGHFTMVVLPSLVGIPGLSETARIAGEVVLLLTLTLAISVVFSLNIVFVALGAAIGKDLSPANPERPFSRSRDS